MAENVQEKESTQVDTNELLAMLTKRVLDQDEKIARLLETVGNGAKKNGRGGRHPAQHVLDTKTNRVYRTKAEAGMAVAPEFGLEIHNFVWYELVKGTKKAPAKCPDRFRVIDEAEFQSRLAKQNASKQALQNPPTQNQNQGQKK